MQPIDDSASDGPAQPMEPSGAAQARGGKRARLTGRQVSARMAAMAGRVPKYLRLAYRLARDNRLEPSQRMLPLAGAAYAMSPVCVVPAIPIDDLAALLMSLRQAVRMAPPEIAAEHLEATGVTMAALDTDVATVGEIARWLVLKAAGGLGRLAGRLARMATPPSGASQAGAGNRPAVASRSS